MKKIIYIEDHVVPQLFTSAIEAYDIEHKASKYGKAFTRLETFGLLWGYSLPAKGDTPAKVIATMCTVETSATRDNGWVEPNFESLTAKKNFIHRYWPNVELVGSFHSHPYNDMAEVRGTKGWRASEADMEFFPYFHQKVIPEQDSLAHLIVAVAKLEKFGWAYPDRLPGGEYDKGYVLSAGYHKLWIRGYTSDRVVDAENEIEDYIPSDESTLEIPSLQNRFK